MINIVSEALLSIRAQRWPWGNQIAVKKKQFEGFSLKDVEGSSDDLTSSDDGETIVNQQPRNTKKQPTDSPDDWDMKQWKKGDTKLQLLQINC